MVPNCFPCLPLLCYETFHYSHLLSGAIKVSVIWDYFMQHLSWHLLPSPGPVGTMFCVYTILVNPPISEHFSENVFCILLLIPSHVGVKFKSHPHFKSFKVTWWGLFIVPSPGMTPKHIEKLSCIAFIQSEFASSWLQYHCPDHILKRKELYICAFFKNVFLEASMVILRLSHCLSCQYYILEY